MALVPLFALGVDDDPPSVIPLTIRYLSMFHCFQSVRTVSLAAWPFSVSALSS